MNLGLEGKRAIVCASLRGLGRACATALAREGCAVVINGLDAKRLATVATKIAAETGADVRAVAANIDTPDGRDTLLAGCVAVLGLVYFVAFADRLALSLLVEPIRAELHVSDTQMGFLFGLSFAMTLIAFSLPFGWLADRVSRRWLVAVTVMFWGLLTMASGFAHSFVELLLCRIGIRADLVDPALKRCRTLDEDVDWLEKVMKEVGIGGSRAGMTLGQFSGQGREVDRLNLSSLHSAKGREFHAVVLFAMEKGEIPWDNQTVEELAEWQRLFYVGFTRAESEIHMMYGETKPSRYVLEVQRRLKAP